MDFESKIAIPAGAASDSGALLAEKFESLDRFRGEDLEHNSFYEEAPGVHRLRIPFEALYTSVFLVESDNVRILVDCGAKPGDVDGYIVRALCARGITLSEVDMLVLTHKHRDHAGGLARVLELAPNIRVVKEVCRLANGVLTYPLAGHTVDCIGVLDERSRTLITCDGLQGAGVDKYPCSTDDRDAYLATLERIRSDERVENLLFSHAYEPFCVDRMCGRESVLECLSKCAEYVKK